MLLVVVAPNVRASVKFPAAELNSIIAQEVNRGCEIRWRTWMDPGVVVFDLERWQATTGSWVKVNATPVVAANSLCGGAYMVLDAAAKPGQTYSYRLLQTDQSGNATILGPFAVTPVPALSSVAALSLVQPLPSVPVVSPSQSVPEPMDLISLASLTGSTFVKITTTNYGWQGIAATYLAALLGQPLAAITNAIAQGQWQLSNMGQPVKWLGAPGGTNLFFYAEWHQDNYSTNNVYFLTSQTNGAVGLENGQAPVPTTASIWYPASVYYKVNVFYESSLPLAAEDDPWMWQQLISISHLGSTVNDYAVVDHLTQGGDRTAQLSLDLWGGVATTHIIGISVNGTALGNWTWNGLVQTNLSVTIPSALLVSGSNKFTFQAIQNGLPASSIWYLNHFALSYPRTYTATNGLVDFSANGNGVITVDGFASNNIVLVDVTNPKQPLLVTNVTLDNPASTWRISFVPASPSAHYVAAQSGVATPVYALALGQVAGLAGKGNTADYLIVAPPSLLSSATNLANYRQQTGLKTIIAPLDQVYNEFGYGFPTPHAIQGLVAAGWTNWTTPPRYLVLLGKGTYDFLNVDNYSNNLTPPLIVSTVYGIFATDSLMGDVYGNGVPEVAVGRLSGLTTNDINALITKIENYEGSAPPAKPQALLVADVPDSGGNFQADIQQTDAVISNKFTDTLIYSQNAGSAEPVHSQITNHWKAGVDLVNYAGHGALEQFGTVGYLTSTDVTNFLSTCPRWPLVTAITCICGQFSQPTADCLGESALQPTNGGGIAFYGATGLSLSGESSEMNVRLSALLATNIQFRLGDMIVQAVAAHVTQDLPTVPVWIYNLMGDPAMYFNVPYVPMLTVAPVNVTAGQGSNAVLFVTASGSKPLTYQWSFNGQNLTGATNSSLVLNNVQPANGGNYTVTVSNSAGTVTSPAASLTVLPAPTPVDGPLLPPWALAMLLMFLGVGGIWAVRRETQASQTRAW